MALEREVKIVRSFNAPRALVWKAWTDPAHVAQWWGPRGFTSAVREWDPRPGGRLHVVMRASDEIAKMIGRTDHPMTGEFTEVVPVERLAFVSSALDENGKPVLEALTTVRLTERDGKTDMVLHASAKGFAEIAARMLEGMEAGWTQSIDKLGELIDADAGTPEFTISRRFNAPRAKVWKAYSDLDALSKWWGPKGFEWIAGTLDFQPGGIFHYGMRSPTGQEMWGRFVYREIVAPERLVFTNSFSDRSGNIVRAPFAEDWPLEVLNVLSFSEANGATTVAMRGTPHNGTDAEKKRFEAMKPSMDMGFKGTLDQLEQYLAQHFWRSTENARSSATMVEIAMSERNAQHGNFTIERKFDAPPALVYSAFATERGKQAWFSGPNDQWSLEERAFDFSVGGRETLTGKWKSGMVSRFDAQYHDIVPDERIIYSYTMHVNGNKISVSLATLEFKKAGAGTLLVLNEQGAFLDGYDDAGSRERGTIGLINKLEAAIRAGKLA